MLILTGMEGNVKRKMTRNFRPAISCPSMTRKTPMRPPESSGGRIGQRGIAPAQIPNSSQM